MFAPVIVIEGIIGSGKTTLTKLLAKELKYEAYFEPVKMNPYLNAFYKDPKKHAFPMQIHLLHHRYALQKKAVFGAALGKGVVLDRSLPGDRVFAHLHHTQGNITDLEWRTYEMAFDVMVASLVVPSVVLYLEVQPQTAVDRIKLRGRECEASIRLDYLELLAEYYDLLLQEIERGNHAWSRGMRVLRFPWDGAVDALPIDLVADAVKALNGEEG